MNAEQYRRWTEPFREDRRLMALLVWGNKIETYLFYLLYPLLLVLVWLFEPAYLPRALLVPAASFALVSVFRRVYNAKRPYEELSIEPLIPKDTKGKSFPSRHVFSVYMIAMAWLPFNTVVGVLLLLLGIDMMCMRVLGGVHYPQDVLAGAACGVLAGIVGFYIVP